MSDETEAALTAAASEFVRGVQATGMAPDPVPLDVAAVAHIAASRPHDEVLAEYSAMLDAREAGEQVDPAVFTVLAQELGLLRLATATVNGRPPGLPHSIVTGPGDASVTGAG
jgi:hypothetical protein